MKRNEIVQKLIKEGLSEKTLANFTDKQLSSLAERLFTEEDVMISKKDPLLKTKVDNAKKLNKTIETYEQKKSVGVKKKKLKKKSQPKTVKEWVEKLVENKYHTLTTKNEIMELITTKLAEQVVTDKPMPKTKAKKGHNGIPEFMTYDSIVSSEPATKPAPSTKPSPTTVPGKPQEKPKPRTPYQPGPGTNPKPKAIKEIIGGELKTDEKNRVIKSILKKSDEHTKESLEKKSTKELFGIFNKLKKSK